MKILITGGCGFVGTNIAIFLSNKKYKISTLDNLSRKGSRYNLNLLKKYNAHTFVGKQKLGFNANTIELWNSYGKKICEKYLIDGEIIKSNIINVDWINHHIDKEDLEIRYVNKFLGLLAVEIWYRLFITNTLDSETTLD